MEMVVMLFDRDEERHQIRGGNIFVGVIIMERG
jgi:hypothetical protein